MEKLKIAMFSDSFFPIWGGRERVIHECMKCHIKRHDARLFCPKIKGHLNGYEDNQLPYKVYRCNSLKVGNTEYLSIPNYSFKKDLKNFSPDIIHCQTKYGLMNYALKYKKKYHIPVVTTIHTIYPKVYKSLRFKPLINYAVNRVIKILNKCDGIVAVSNFAKETMEKCGVNVPIRVIRNGINIKKYDFNEQTKEQIRKKYNIDKDNFIIMFTGWLQPRKNILFQLECLKEVVKSNDKITFIIAGDGDQKEELIKFVTKNNLTKNVVFTGFIGSQEELYSIYYTSDLFYFASLTDSDGLVVVEAALNKTPSLVLKGMAACERIQNNFNGFICENDVEDCKQKLLEIMKNKRMLTNISINAYNSIPKSWEDISKEYESFYEEIINKGV